MNAETAGLVGSIFGALVGGPAGYLFERILSRARIAIQYAEAAYEDVISIPSEMQRNIMRYKFFVDFVESQIKWSFTQRLIGNLFSKEELRVVQELATHFLELQGQGAGAMKRWEEKINSGDPRELEHVKAELQYDYKEFCDANLSDELLTDGPATKAKLINMIEVGQDQIAIGSKWLADFMAEVDRRRRAEKGSSSRVIVRVGIANNGLQDGVFKTESRLKSGGKIFRLPIQVGSRPWEAEAAGASQYYLLPTKSFRVLEFVVDERLNALADVEELRKNLGKGTPCVFQALGIGDGIIADKRFQGSLP